MLSAAVSVPYPVAYRLPYPHAPPACHRVSKRVWQHAIAIADGLACASKRTHGLRRGLVAVEGGVGGGPLHRREPAVRGGGHAGQGDEKGQDGRGRGRSRSHCFPSLCLRCVVLSSFLAELCRRMHGTEWIYSDRYCGLDWINQSGGYGDDWGETKVVYIFARDDVPARTRKNFGDY